MQAAQQTQIQVHQASAQADQAAAFAAEQMAQRVQWSRLDWWPTSEGTVVMAIAPADAATNKLTTFATLWHRAAAH